VDRSYLLLATVPSPLCPLNAVIHRDYYESGEVAVEKLKNAILINNPGGLIPSFPREQFGNWGELRIAWHLLSFIRRENLNYSLQTIDIHQFYL
jgi:predicted HTH transcriptional regulator